MDLDSIPSPGGAEAESDSDGQIFAARPVGLEHLGVTTPNPRIVGLTAANGSVLAACQSGEVVRWYPIENEASVVDFGRDKCGDVGRVLLEPKGFHALITNNGGDSWYLNFQSNQAKALPRLKGHVIEAAAWDPDSTASSTRDLIVGTIGGQILHVVVDGKEKVRSLLSFGEGLVRVPVCGVQRERSTAPDGSERIVVFAAAGCGVYAFVGPTLDSFLTRYSGEAAVQKALVYEVPRDSPHGDLQVDVACVGSASTRVLFWLTGVGVLVAAVKNPIEADGTVLESPPGLIPFPRSAKAQQQPRIGGSLVASLLPAPPPPAPLSMALTRYHVIFVFEDRWAAVSRVTHEVVQQQEWATASYGGLRGITRDVHGEEKLWLFSEKHLFELTADAEDRNVWTLLLRLEQFEDAHIACKKATQAQRVLAAHADWLFRNGKLIESARKFADASSVPFEHVALRFLGVDDKAALLEYFRRRLEMVEKAQHDDKVTRALLGVWAVEISLAYLNELRLRTKTANDRAVLDSERAKLHDLLKACKDLDVHATVYHLLQSHGWLQELALFAEARRDYTTVILHHVSRRDSVSAIRKLTDFSVAEAIEDLVCRFAPVLFGAEPQAFISLLLRPQLGGVDPLLVLPAVYAPRSPAAHRREAVRYLDYAARNHPELMGQPIDDFAESDSATAGKALKTGSLPVDSTLAEVADAGEASPARQGGWASGTAVLNALTMLYACDCNGGNTLSEETAATVPKENGGNGDGAAQGALEAEDTLIRFLAAQDGNRLLDPHFALRICGEKGLARATVHVYGILGLHEEAVEVALRRGDVALAKRNACKPAEKRLRQKLWLRIVENEAASGDVQRITGLIRESQELSVRDVLPYMSDLMTIDAFQAEICECLDSYDVQIMTLRQEMDDHRRALQAFKEDLKHAEERCVVISQDQACEICGAPAVRERFYVFACRHCFHEACLRALVVPVLGAERRERLFTLEAMRLEHQAAAAGALAGSVPAMTLAEVEEELDGILADDCPLCGHLMIQTIRRPFIDPGEEAEVESWAIT